MQQDLGKDSGLGLALLRNTVGKHARQALSMSNGATFPSCMAGHVPPNSEEDSRKKALPCSRLVSTGLKSILRALVPLP